ncbi:MAG: acireductone synthase [Gammaproteobacteria bacterium]|nr:acireductone synthase [Gammaproteobacteria bacterium]MBU1553267.1 acireductone synthase [Gammaproteobacteria bacterium]MBU2070885.1 acireductone synthase [Gammaproteobacteria bacterium]MBU2185022.1 acireductone synthase [Gammaproteobacteria bacterium]MBU2204091.1 acireductone synthase [Gammaproteobacteria bacterium]
MKYSAIITDIEGTTSRISFVTEILFPYAAAQLPAFIQANADKPAVAEQLNACRSLMQQADASIAAISAQLLQWIATDQKITPLKALQGMVWQHGYQSGAFKGHVYADVHAALSRWQQLGVKLYVYSSGSVQAQQLLFQYSDFGDMTPLFSGYFDTRIGAKRELSSYAAILQQLQLPPKQVLFLSDVVAELDAATQLGIATMQLIRDGQAASGHAIAHNFTEVMEQTE